MVPEQSELSFSGVANRPKRLHDAHLQIDSRETTKYRWRAKDSGISKFRFHSLRTGVNGARDLLCGQQLFGSKSIGYVKKYVHTFGH